MPETILATLTPNAMPDAALERFVSLERDRPDGGNPHPPMLENRYVSGSQTVKLTCQALADRISGKVQDQSDPHWGTYGNLIADWNLQRVPYGENTASVPITGTAGAEGELDWTLEIHADGLALLDAEGRLVAPPSYIRRFFTVVSDFIDDFFLGQHKENLFWLAICEHKAPLYPYDDDAWDIARRQAIAFMGAALWMHEAGHTHLQPAAYLREGDPRRVPFMLPENLEAGAINLVCAPYTQERERRVERITAQQARQEIERLVAKARAAVWTTTGRDPDAAARWDREHPEEFLWRSTERVPANRDEAHREVARLVAAHRLAQAPPDPMKAVREKARDRIKALVAKHGLPREVAFDTGVGYKLTAKDSFTSQGDPAPAAAEAGAAALAELAGKGAVVAGVQQPEAAPAIGNDQVAVGGKA